MQFVEFLKEMILMTVTYQWGCAVGEECGRSCGESHHVSGAEMTRLLLVVTVGESSGYYPKVISDNLQGTSSDLYINAVLGNIVLVLARHNNYLSLSKDNEEVLNTQ